MNLQTVKMLVVGGVIEVIGVIGVIEVIGAKDEKGGSPRFTGMTIIVVHVKMRITCAQVVLCFIYL